MLVTSVVRVRRVVSRQATTTMQRAGHRQSGGGTAFASPSTSAYGASTSSFGTPEVSRFVPFKGTYTQKYAHRLTFYDRAPKDEITLDDFELWSLDRLRGAS